MASSYEWGRDSSTSPALPGGTHRAARHFERTGVPSAVAAARRRPAAEEEAMNTTWKAILATAITSLTVACGGSGKGLSVSTRAATTTAGATADGLKLPDGILIQRIRMAVQRVSVEGGDAMRPGCLAPALTAPMQAGPDPMTAATTSSGGHDDGAGDDEGCELAFGPFDVDLAGSTLAGGAISWAFEVPIPDGVYEEISVKVNTVPAALSGGSPVLRDLAAAHASIIVDGLVDPLTSTQKPFSFTTPMQVKQEREGTITVGTGANVTLDFTPDHWFDAAAGGRLDPTDPTNQGEILANIRASIRLLKDSDHDGCDDDHASACATAQHP